MPNGVSQVRKSTSQLKARPFSRIVLDSARLDVKKATTNYFYGSVFRDTYFLLVRCYTSYIRRPMWWKTGLA